MRVNSPPMADTILFTGFPGFIGKQVVKQLAQSREDAEFHLLVEPRMVDAAERAVGELAGGNGPARRLKVQPGDITDRALGLDPTTYKTLADNVTKVYHLAAAYHLAIPEDVSQRVNVVGTLNILDFCKAARKLDHLHYVSTSYVAGDRLGYVYEHELEMGQRFKNFYESTKFQAEVAVRDSMPEIPTTIYRPGIVVGNSKTGETQKFDGPYYGLRVIAAAVSHGIPPFRVGPGRAPINLVPVDFIIDAMTALADDTDAIGQTLHVVDPDPMTSREVYDLLCLEYSGMEPRWRVPAAPTSLLLRIPQVRHFFGDTPRQSLAYQEARVVFDTRNAQRLLGAHGVHCPSFRDYVGPLVQFFKAHENDPTFEPATG